MSPCFLFWAVSFANYNHKPWCGTGGNRLPIHYTQDWLGPESPVTASGPLCAKQADEEDMEAKAA